MTAWASAYDHPVVAMLAAALLGLSLGFGLVIGAFVARALRRYMEAEDLKPYAAGPARRRRRHHRDDDEGGSP